MNTPPPAHLPKFQDWIVRSDGKADGTAKIYARFLTHCAEHYAETINEQTVRNDADVQRIINAVSGVVNQRGRWVKGTFNTFDVKRNLVFALQAYARFAEAVFPTGSTAQTPEFRQAADVPNDELPQRLKMEVSRLIRDTKVVREVKAAHGNTCQVCSLKLELSPGRLYSEGHHLKPLGQPHSGPDVKDNILCVCPNCHTLLDFAAVKIDPKKLRTASGHSVRQEFIDYHNQLCP